MVVLLVVCLAGGAGLPSSVGGRAGAGSRRCVVRCAMAQQRELGVRRQRGARTGHLLAVEPRSPCQPLRARVATLL